MTVEEVFQIGVNKLKEFEPRLKLKIKGRKTYHPSNSTPLSIAYEGNLLFASPEIVGDGIGRLLERLTELDGDFWASSPDYKSCDHSGCQFFCVPNCEERFLEIANCYDGQKSGWRVNLLVR